VKPHRREDPNIRQPGSPLNDPLRLVYRYAPTTIRDVAFASFIEPESKHSFTFAPYISTDTNLSPLHSRSSRHSQRRYFFPRIQLSPWIQALDLRASAFRSACTYHGCRCSCQPRDRSLRECLLHSVLRRGWAAGRELGETEEPWGQAIYDRKG
jgi:hypothetical protein